jgi:hypothetical protein
MRCARFSLAFYGCLLKKKEALDMATAIIAYGPPQTLHKKIIRAVNEA